MGVIWLAIFVALGAEAGPQQDLTAGLRELFNDKLPDLLAAEAAADFKNLAILVDEPPEHLLKSIEQARSMAKQQRWREAVEAYETVAASNSDADFPLSRQLYLPVSEYARLKLALLPVEARQVYRGIYDPAAGKLLREGVAKHDPQALEAASRYLASSFADDALELLGDIYLERGDFVQARACYVRLLLRCPDSDRPLGPILRKVALCSAALARGGEADCVVAFIGEQFGQEFAGPIDQVPGVAVPAATDWPTFGGDNTHARPIEHTTQPGPKASWAVAINDVMEEPPGYFPRPAGRPAPLLPAVNPICVDGVVYFRTASMIYAISLATGQVMWYHNEPNALPNRVNYGYPRLSRDYFVAYADGRLFADITHQMADPRGVIAIREKTKLIALRAQAGQRERQPLWQVGLPGQGDAFLDTVTFCSPPTAAVGKVFAGASKLSGDEEYLCCLDAETGNLLWKRFICCGPNLFYGSATPAELPAEANGVVYYVSGRGMVAAVEAPTGRILWKYLYAEQTRSAVSYAVAGQRAANPPIVSNGVLYFLAPFGSTLHALDTATGQPLWQQAVSGMVYLVGTSKGDVWLAGETAMCLNAMGRDQANFALDHIKWQSERFTDMPVGRGVVTDRLLLVPTPTGVDAVDLVNGALLGLRRPYIVWEQLPQVAVDYRGPKIAGNLVMAGGKLLSASSVQLSCFDRRVELSEIQRKLQQEPNDPEGYKMLGQHHLWEMQYEQAAGALERALELVRDNTPGAAKEREEILSPLFATYFDMASERLRANDLPAAEKWLSRSLDRAPNQPSQLKVLFALADLNYRMEQFPKAVDTYQRILAEMPNEPYKADADLTVKAGLYARARLQELLRRAGREVYRKYDDEAAKLLATARAQGSEEPLASLLAQYPCSSQVPAALLELGRLAEKNRDDATASGWYAQVLDYYPATPAAEEAEKLQIACLERRGQTAAAKALREGTGTGSPPLLLPLTCRWQVAHEPLERAVDVVAPGDAKPEVVLHVLERDLECRDLRDGRLRWANTVAWLGIRLQDGIQTKGAQIQDVLPGTPAAACGLGSGDVITRFGDAKLEDSSDLIQICANSPAGSKVKLQIDRNGRAFEVVATLGARPPQQRQPYDAYRLHMLGRQQDDLLMVRDRMVQCLDPASGMARRRFAIGRRDPVGGMAVFIGPMGPQFDEGDAFRLGDDQLLAFAGVRQQRVVGPMMPNAPLAGSIALWQPSTGQCLWKKEVDGQPMGRPVVAGDWVVVPVGRLAGTDVVAFKRSDGSQPRRLTIDTRTQREVFLAALGDGRVCIGSAGVLTFCDLKADRVVRALQLGQVRIDGMQYSPPRDGSPGILIAIHDNWNLSAVAVDTGRTLWTKGFAQQGLMVSMLVADGVVYAASRTGANRTFNIEAFDVVKGEPLWSASRSGATLSQQMLVAGRYLLVARAKTAFGNQADSSELLVLDRATGKLAQEIEMKHRHIVSMALVGSTLCVATTDALYCFSGPEPGS
jgi:outer membrane protein assembly factor BamB/TolA-binding protein